MSFRVFGIDAVSYSTYSRLQKGLHAISMIIIVWLMTSGYFAAYITRIPEVKEAVSAFNVALATLFAPVFVFRMCVSFGKGYADVLRSSDVMRYAAFVVHKNRVGRVLGSIRPSRRRRRQPATVPEGISGLRR